VLIRRVLVSTRLGEATPADYLSLLDRLAEAADAIATDLGADRSPEAVVPRLVELARATSEAASPPTLSEAVVLGQIRSIVVDLLQLAGLSYADAVAFVPPRE
jgi:hypothetical protein